MEKRLEATLCELRAIMGNSSNDKFKEALRHALNNIHEALFVFSTCPACGKPHDEKKKDSFDPYTYLPPNANTADYILKDGKWVDKKTAVESVQKYKKKKPPYMRTPDYWGEPVEKKGNLFKHVPLTKPDPRFHWFESGDAGYKKPDEPTKAQGFYTDPEDFKRRRHEEVVARMDYEGMGKPPEPYVTHYATKKGGDWLEWPYRSVKETSLIMKADSIKNPTMFEYLDIWFTALKYSDGKIWDKNGWRDK